MEAGGREALSLEDTLATFDSALTDGREGAPRRKTSYSSVSREPHDKAWLFATFCLKDRSYANQNRAGTNAAYRVMIWKYCAIWGSRCGLKVPATDIYTFQVRTQPVKSIILVRALVFWTNDMTGYSPTGFSSIIN